MTDTESSSPLNFNSTDIHFPHKDLELIFLSTHWYSKNITVRYILLEDAFVGRLVRQDKCMTTQTASHLHRHVKSLHKTGTCVATLHACE